MTDWKNAHANSAQEAVKHELVEGVVEELLDNLGLPDSGLPAYGVRKDVPTATYDNGFLPNDDDRRVR